MSIRQRLIDFDKQFAHVGGLAGLLPTLTDSEYEIFVRETTPQQADWDEASALAKNGDAADWIFLQWPHVRFDWFQIDIINSILNPLHTETFIKGCTKPGKGFAVAVAINGWYDLFGPDCRVILCGPKHQHVHDIMFAEAATVRKQMKNPGRGEIRAESFWDGEKHQVTISVPETGEGFSGAHSSHSLFVYDEASSVPAFLYDNSKKQSRHTVALSNPRTLSSWFRDAFPSSNPDETQTIYTSSGRRRLITVGGKDCLNVIEKRLEKQLGPLGGIDIAGRHFKMGEEIPPEFYAQVKLLIPNQLDYGRYLEIMSHPDPKHRAVFGDGQFPTEDEAKQIILNSWLQRHREAHQFLTRDDVDAFALDVSLGEVKSEGRPVLAAGGAKGCFALHECLDVTKAKSGESSTASIRLVNWTLRVAQDQYGIDLTRGRSPICVDADVIGRGVADILTEKGCWVIPFRGQKVADDPRAYGNSRAEAYGELGLRLDPRVAEETWAIPDDSELAEELCAPEKIFKSDDPFRFFITPKDRPGKQSDRAMKTLVDILGRSPDKADALVYLWTAVRALAGLVVKLVHRPLVLDLDAMKASAAVAKAAEQADAGPIVMERDEHGKWAAPAESIPRVFDPKYNPKAVLAGAGAPDNPIARVIRGMDERDDALARLRGF